MLVLLVEDLGLAAKIAKYVLNSLNCEVDIASSGQEAIRKAQSGAHALVLMDLGLPDLSGVATTRAIREFSDVPIYALTAHTDDGHKQEALNAGMNGFLIKPLDEAEVKTVIEKTLQADTVSC